MNRIILILLVFAAVAGWQVSQYIDPDVFLFSVGVIVGVLAGMPAALLMLVGQRRSESRNERRNDRGWDDAPRRGRYDGYPPMINVPPQQMYPALPQQQPPAQPQANPWMVTGGGHFDDMPAPQQDGRFKMGGA